MDYTMELTIKNKDFLRTLEETSDMFIEHKDLMGQLAKNLGNVPIGEGKKYTEPETYYEALEQAENHTGFPTRGYAFQVFDGLISHSKIFYPLNEHTKYNLVQQFNANSNSLTSYYPPKGYIEWHTNWNAFGYQIIFTWSESGDGYFRYFDKEKNDFVTHEDKKGWQARWYRFGRLNEPEHHCWHSAWTECPRLTLAYKFSYKSVTPEQAFMGISDLIEEIES